MTYFSMLSSGPPRSPSHLKNLFGARQRQSSQRDIVRVDLKRLDVREKKFNRHFNVRIRLFPPYLAKARS
jgi:hypothetical protein